MLTGSIPHMDGIRGPQPHMGPRDYGFTSQDAEIMDRDKFRNQSMPRPSTHNAFDDGHITLGPKEGLGKGIEGRAQPFPYVRSALTYVPPFTSVSNR